MDTELFIAPHGHILCVYDDAVVPPIRELGNTRTTRISKVEPNQDRWLVDIILLNGTLFRVGDFETRTEALEREKEWLSIWFTTNKTCMWKNGCWVETEAAR